MLTDWGSTGSMLTGIGTMMGAGAVLTAAIVGRSTFQSWKRQKVEERVMDVAERVLVLTYKLQATIESARSRLVLEAEHHAAYSKLTQQVPGFANLDLGQQSQMAVAQAIIDRLEEPQAEWDEFWALKPLILAYFDPETQKMFMAFWTLRSTLTMLARELANDDRRDRKHTAHLRKELFGGELDTVGLAMKEAVERLEETLRPRLQAGTGS